MEVASGVYSWSVCSDVEAGIVKGKILKRTKPD